MLGIKNYFIDDGMGYENLPFYIVYLHTKLSFLDKLYFVIVSYLFLYFQVLSSGITSGDNT